jgi:hypothetical protein
MREAQRARREAEPIIKRTDEQRKRISDAHKGIKYGPCSEEKKARLSEAMSGRVLGPLPDETKRKLSEALKGRQFSKDTREKISKALTGKVQSEAHRLANSKGHIGVVLSDEHRRKISEANMGPKNKCWKGGRCSLTKLRCNRAEWKRLRDKILERDNYECQICGSKESIQVHHKLPVRCGGTDNDNNLISLCVSHHSKTEQRFIRIVESCFGGLNARQ